MNFKIKFKKNKGITLIALVVTIIVLLILAGISITMLTGQNGILDRAGEAKNANGVAQGEELIKVSVMDALTRGTGELTDENLRKALSSNLGTEGKDYEIVGSENCGWTVTIKENDKDYKISSTGKIGEIEKVEGSSSEWRVEGNAVVEYLGSDNDIVIPNYVDGVKITEIGENIFNKYTSSEKTGSLTISDGIKVIGTNAFGNNKFTGSLVLPTSLKTIMSGAFTGCSGLTGNLIIPDSVEVIGGTAFASCSGLDGKLVLPAKVKEIGDYAFAGCTGFIGDLIIPDNVNIGQGAFQAMQVLGDVYVGKNVQGMNMNTSAKSKKVIMNSLINDYATMQRFPEIESCWISSDIIKDIKSVEMFTYEDSVNKDSIIYTNAAQDDPNWPDKWNPNNIKVVYDTSLDEYYKLTN